MGIIIIKPRTGFSLFGQPKITQHIQYNQVKHGFKNLKNKTIHEIFNKHMI